MLLNCPDVGCELTVRASTVITYVLLDWRQWTVTQVAWLGTTSIVRHCDVTDSAHLYLSTDRPPTMYRRHLETWPPHVICIVAGHQFHMPCATHTTWRLKPRDIVFSSQQPTHISRHSVVSPVEQPTNAAGTQSIHHSVLLVLTNVWSMTLTSDLFRFMTLFRHKDAAGIVCNVRSLK